MGPNFGNNGIVTFCDQVQVREFCIDHDAGSKTPGNERHSSMDLSCLPPVADCSAWSEAPCPSDRWCADLHGAFASGAFAVFDGQGQAAKVADLSAPLDCGGDEDVGGEESEASADVECGDCLHDGPSFDCDFETESFSLLQAHHLTSGNRLNLQALDHVAPSSGEFLVTVRAVEFGMGSSTSTTIRLHRGQEATWTSSILLSKPLVFRGGSISDKKAPQIVVVDPQPMPTPLEISSNPQGVVNIHVIVDTFSHTSCESTLLLTCLIGLDGDKTCSVMMFVVGLLMQMVGMIQRTVCNCMEGALGLFTLHQLIVPVPPRVMARVNQTLKTVKLKDSMR